MKFYYYRSPITGINYLYLGDFKLFRPAQL